MLQILLIRSPEACEHLPASQAEPGGGVDLALVQALQVQRRLSVELILPVCFLHLLINKGFFFKREEEGDLLGYLGFPLFKMKSTVHRGNTYLHMLIKYLHGNIQNTVI